METTNISVELQPIDQSKAVPEHPLIDIVKSIESGEFGPCILSLLNDYISPDFLTPDGYNILHQAVAFNGKEIVYLLIEKLKIPVDILSQTRQTGLMIAANFGFIELEKYLLDKGANVDSRDECNFNALLYATKQGEMNSLIYLLHRGSDILLKDNNGCGIVHWAAFKNNLFLLRLLKRLGLPLNEMDFHGFRPVDRAIASHSFDAVRFLLNNVDGEINIGSLNSMDVKNEEIKGLLIERMQKGSKLRVFLREKILRLRKFIVFMAYLLWLFLTLIIFHEEENEAKSRYSQYYIEVLVILALWVYLLCYVIYLLMDSKSSSPIKPTNVLNSYYQDPIYSKFQALTPEKMDTNFFNLDNLVAKDISSLNSGTPTILHQISHLIDSYHFLDVLDIDYNRVCPTCLIYKPPKCKHCSKCNRCVENFHHHSEVFNRCFDHKHHVFYVGLLILQALLVTLVLKCVFGAFEERKSWFFLFGVETLYLIYMEKGKLTALAFLLNSIIFCYNAFFLLIEIYGICWDLTYNEMLNRNRYRYLFRREKTPKGKTIYVFGNGFNNGVLSNIKRYFSQYFNA